MIIKELTEEFRSEIHCIPEDKEKYKTFSIPIMYRTVKDYEIPYNLRFIDSNNFMMDLLDTHVNNLSELYVCNCSNKSNQQKTLKNKFPNTYHLVKDNIDKFILLLKKGVYPYEYMNDWKKFEETELPSNNEFYSNLNLRNISKEDIKHAQNVWNTFNIKNIGEYHDLYVQSDTTQLADTFEQFRTVCLKEYKLDPAYFCTTPGLAIEACLKLTHVKLELLADIDMVLMFEKGIRGGLSQAIQRYATANNKYMPNYNLKQISAYLMYVDANNLYGWTISKKLPIDSFKWNDNLEIFTSEFTKNYNEDSDTGYLLEVDTQYPKKLHEKHRDLPFLPIKKDKLLTTLEDKERYVVHIQALKQALLHGLKFKKVHRVISFRQKEWLKPYIDKNTELRKNAKNEFEKDFFKLMNNAVFGKTMENVRNRRDVKLIVTEERRKKLVSEPNYDSCKFFSESLMAIEMRKTEVLMDKPIAVGQAVLDVSKTLMYEFWYDYLKSKYQDKTKLCYMDTDSFIIHIETDDFNKDISNDVDKWFDTSNYDKNDNRPLKIAKNKKVIGKFKDELGGKLLLEFVALRAKTYAFVQLNNENQLEEHEKAKGTKKCVIKKHLNFDLYKKALFNNARIRCSQQRFKSEYHNIYTQTVHKTALNNKDDKRIQSFDGITTYPYGMGKDLINKLENEIKQKPIQLYY